MDRATERPWARKRMIFKYEILGPDRRNIASSIDEDDARLIVTAVNSHDQMRAALEKIASFSGDLGGNMKKARYIARATLHNLAATQETGDEK